MKRWLALLALALTSCNSSLPESRSAASAASKADVSFEAFRFETSAGPFTAILYPEVAPETVARYQDYVDSGYFVGRSFDRVIPGFVIQLTDCAISFVTRDSRTLPLEPSEDYFFSAGALGIARAASPNSGGPEFFVMDFAAAHLNNEYTVFGQVVEGMDVIRRAARVMAVDLTAGGQVPGVVGDRCALMPVEISATTRTTVTMSAQDAARYPLHTAARVRTDTASYNLEWPATLAAKRETELTVYIRMVDQTQAPPAAQDLAVTIAGVSLGVEAGEVAGIYRFRWAPPAKGIFDAVISAAGAELATLQIEVR